MTQTLITAIPATAPYLQALCNVTQLQNIPNDIFGVAIRLGVQHSAPNLPAARVIHSLVEFSPAAETLAIEFLNEFRKVTPFETLGSISLIFEYLLLVDHITVGLVLSGGAEPNAQQWAQGAIQAFCNYAQPLNDHQRALLLKPIVDLTSEYLTHVLIAGWSYLMKLILLLILLTVQNKGGTRTNQVSAVPTPGLLQELGDIIRLIKCATCKQDQAALKKLVCHHFQVLKMMDFYWMQIYLCDGYSCPVTDASFE